MSLASLPHPGTGSAREMQRSSSAERSIDIGNRAAIANAATAESQPVSNRQHIIQLVTNLPEADLPVVADLLSTVIAQQHQHTRGLTRSEIDSLGTLGIPETALTHPSALPAASTSALWERRTAQFSYTVAETATLLGVTPARVRQRCAAATLLAQRHSDGWHLPRFQFPDDRELPGWATVARVIPPASPLLLVERVLTSPAPRLRSSGTTLAPIEWLIDGGDPSEAARAVDEALNLLP